MLHANPLSQILSIRSLKMILQLIVSLLLSITIFFVAFYSKAGESGLASNLNALMIVLGGTFAATLFAYPWKKLAWMFQLLKKAFFARDETGSTINRIVDLAHIYRHGGIRALEQEGKKVPPGLIKTSIELMAFHCSRDTVEQVVQKEAQLTYAQYETAHRILHNMARLAPALGLVGTIVILIRVFGHMTDPRSLVGNMALALLSTFYGVVLANLCFVPLSNKLMEFMDREEIRLDLIREGILDLYDGANPRLTRFKLETLSANVMKPDTAPRQPNLRLSLMASRRRSSSVIS
jgi:chemotaxis protein MotA